MAVKGISEGQMVGILKQERFKPGYAGKATCRKAGSQQVKVHVTNLLQATIDAAA